jgi:hypothetical protein
MAYMNHNGFYVWLNRFAAWSQASCSPLRKAFAVHLERPTKTIGVGRLRELIFDFFKIIIAENSCPAIFVKLYTLPIKPGPLPSGDCAWRDRHKFSEPAHSQRDALKLYLSFKFRSAVELGIIIGKRFSVAVDIQQFLKEANQGFSTKAFEQLYR